MSKKKTPQAATAWIRIRRIDEFTFEAEEFFEDGTTDVIARDIFPICLDKATEKLVINAGIG